MNARTVSISLGLLSALTLSPHAFAVSGCTNSNLSGSYAMPFSGYSAATPSSVAGLAVAAPSSAQLPSASGAGPAAGFWRVAGASRLVFDGAGSVTGYSFANIAGQWTQGSFSGTYNVNPDCSFSYALTDANGGAANYSGVLAADGGSAALMQTDAGTGFAGTLVAIRNSCQTSDLSGNYALQYSGAALGAAGAPYTSVGVLTLDGQGNLTASEARVSGGAPSQAQSTGAITVNADCSVTMALSSENGTVNFFGFPSTDGKRLVLVQSDAGTAASGTVVAQ